MSVRLFLASQSPRRRELLHQLGVEFEVLDVEVPEERRPGEAPFDYVSRVARAKAAAGLQRLAGQPGVRVLGADTEVVQDDEVFGKPADADGAAAMLRRLSGRTHVALSVLWCMDAAHAEQAASESRVTFADLTEAAIRAYVASGEPFGRAGAYAIQGRAGAFVRHLEGSYSGVMGLPLHETARVLARFGIGPFAAA